MTLEPDDRDAIDHLRAQERATRRATVPALEEVLYTPFAVLDHGFVRVVDYMGDDAAVVQAARVSYGSGTKNVRSDAGLIRYLMRQRHSTPFEMCEIKLHVKLPIFVARQWIRHRTANVNEYSARYSILDREFYLPDAAAVATQSTANRQGRGDTLPPAAAEAVRARMDTHARAAFDLYDALLAGDGDGDGAAVRSPASSVAPCCHFRPTRSGTGRSICTICCISWRSVPTRTPRPRSAPTPRCCSISSTAGSPSPPRRSATIASKAPTSRAGNSRRSGAV